MFLQSHAATKLQNWIEELTCRERRVSKSQPSGLIFHGPPSGQGNRVWGEIRRQTNQLHVWHVSRDWPFSIWILTCHGWARGWVRRWMRPNGQLPVVCFGIRVIDEEFVDLAHIDGAVPMRVSRVGWKWPLGSERRRRRFGATAGSVTHAFSILLLTVSLTRGLNHWLAG